MPVLSITKTYANGLDLTETDLDNIKNSLETFFNTTKIDSTNVQTGGLIGANLANGTITSTQIATNGIITTNITDLNVTSGKLATNIAIAGSLTIGSGGIVITSSASDVLALALSSTTGGLYLAGSSRAALRSGMTGTSSALAVSVVDSTLATAYPIVVSAVPATNPLLVVRGTYYWSGSAMVIISGEGFTVARTATGRYTVTFTTAFGDVPVVANLGTAICSHATGTTPTTTVYQQLFNGGSTDATGVTVFAGFVAFGQRAA